MYDTGKVLIGIAVFLGFMLSPFAYNQVIGDGGQLPEPQLPASGKCMKDTAWMQANHMTLLVEWRDEVVRDGDRAEAVGEDGILYDKSLTRTCLGCHKSKAQFCDRCHNSTDVSPTCFNCHVEEWENKP